MKKSLIFLVGLAGLTAFGSSAAQPDLVAAGRRLAVRNCVECHAVEPGWLSRMGEAPRLPDLYKTFRVERFAEAMEKDEFTGTPHMKAFDLDADERVQLQAFLMSFRPRKIGGEATSCDH